MEQFTLKLEIMNGVDDGRTIHLATANNEGRVGAQGEWVISIGRKEDTDVSLTHDTFVSRKHARLRYRAKAWWLEDNDSKNGTFVEHVVDIDNDQEVKGMVPLKVGQLFRVGKTWMRIQA